MTDMIKNEEGCEAIMDNIILFGRSAEEHDENLNGTLQVMKESGLKLSEEKLEFKRVSLTYFGHVPRTDGLSPDPEKVKAISELQATTNVPELDKLIGMINYLERFVPNLATIMQPMTNLLKSDRGWTWGPSSKRYLLMSSRWFQVPWCWHSMILRRLRLFAQMPVVMVLVGF